MSQVQIAKATTRSFAGSPQANFEYTDLSKNLMIIPNTWSLADSLGIFTKDTTNMETVSIEEITSGFGLITDIHRGARHQVSIDSTRRLHAFALPHFTLDDAITPRDVQGKRAFGADVLETVAAVRARKMETIRRSWAATHEKARWHTITTGTAYAPNGTVAYDWYEFWGKTRKVVSFALATATTDLIAKTEEVFGYVQDNSEDGTVRSDIYGVASPEFFSALIAHPTMKALYLAYQQQPNILKDRLTAAGFDARFRSFTVGNITYIEYRGVGPDGQRYIPAGDCYFLPGDTAGEFVEFYGPADHFDYINTQGQEMYAFEYGDNRGQMIEINTESNFINVLRRPQLIVRGTLA